MKHFDRSSPLLFEIFANGYSVIITEFQPKSIKSNVRSFSESPAPSNCSSHQVCYGSFHVISLLVLFVNHTYFVRNYYVFTITMLSIDIYYNEVDTQLLTCLHYIHWIHDLSGHISIFSSELRKLYLLQYTRCSLVHWLSRLASVILVRPYSIVEMTLIVPAGYIDISCDVYWYLFLSQTWMT